MTFWSISNLRVYSNFYFFIFLFFSGGGAEWYARIEVSTSTVPVLVVVVEGAHTFRSSYDSQSSAALGPPLNRPTFRDAKSRLFQPALYDGFLESLFASCDGQSEISPLVPDKEQPDLFKLWTVNGFHSSITF